MLVAGGVVDVDQRFTIWHLVGAGWTALALADS